MYENAREDRPRLKACLMDRTKLPPSDRMARGRDIAHESGRNSVSWVEPRVNQPVPSRMKGRAFLYKK